MIKEQVKKKDAIETLSGINLEKKSLEKHHENGLKPIQSGRKNSPSDGEKKTQMLTESRGKIEEQENQI